MFKMRAKMISVGLLGTAALSMSPRPIRSVTPLGMHFTLSLRAASK
jgi:hypothetical protein